ncbi:MAG: HEAT repeat domain-containing protein [Lentisphaeria bacterium]|nr:HEAT repeat domain-containing protein [Lentisphaeria bacterium]NQZ68179.1 HEAT repeat domain-containing protein [Lentisphaeria bacterium]
MIKYEIKAFVMYRTSLWIVLLFSSCLFGQDSKEADRKLKLTVRETMEFLRNSPKHWNKIKYHRLDLANPAAKALIYEYLKSTEFRNFKGILSAKMSVAEMDATHSKLVIIITAGFLIGTIGDERDVKRLVQLIPKGQWTYLAHTIRLALARLGDKGFLQAYKELENMLNSIFLNQFVKIERDGIIKGTIGTLIKSNYPNVKEVLLKLPNLSPEKKALRDKDLDERIRSHKYSVNRDERYLERFKDESKSLYYRFSQLHYLRGSKAAPIISDVQKLISKENFEKVKHKDSALQYSLVFFAEMGEVAKPAARVIRRYLEHKTPVIRACAIIALGQIKDDSEVSKKALLKVMRDKHPIMRLYAITSLGELGSKLNEETKAALYDILENDKITKVDSIHYLDQTSTSANIPRFLPLVIRDSYKNRAPLKCAVAYTLNKCNEVSVKAIITVLQGDNDMLKFYTLENIPVGWEGKEKLTSELIIMLNQKNNDLAGLAAQALIKINIKNKDIIDTLEGELNKGNIWKKMNVVKALGHLGNAGTIEKLKALKTDNEFLIEEVEAALKLLKAKK